LFGAIFIPTEFVRASFLASLFGDQVYAQTDASVNTVSLPKLGSNSQTIGILQANVSSASMVEDKNKAKGKVEEIDTNANIYIVSDNALAPSVGALSGVGGVSADSEVSFEDKSVYVIRKGDSLSQIAQMFNVSENTILWANGMKKGDKLNEGDVLFILPISGLEHTVTKGQTLAGIAKLYKVEVGDIILSNDVAIDTVLNAGDILIIPDAQKSEESDKPIKNPSASLAKDKKYYDTHNIKNLAGYFINPVPGYRLSQGLHDRTAVDLAIAKGTPIHASAAGKVILARTGYNGGYGNLVIISHPNGTETLYAHQSKIATKTGAEVYQGEIIGYVGSTGRSTGPHLHFEVRGARNPGIDKSWKY